MSGGTCGIHVNTCFTHDAQVTLEDGTTMDISQIKLDTRVKTGFGEIAVVEQVVSYNISNLHLYGFSNERIFATGNHPFIRNGISDVVAFDPKLCHADDPFIGCDGENRRIWPTQTLRKCDDSGENCEITVLSGEISSMFEPNSVIVYNLRLRDYHSYIVNNYVVSDGRIPKTSDAHIHTHKHKHKLVRIIQDFLETELYPRLNILPENIFTEKDVRALSHQLKPIAVNFIYDRLL